MMQAAVNDDYKKFMRYGRFIYGYPSAEIFAFTISRLQAKAKQLAEQDNSSIKQAAVDLLAVLPSNLPSVTLELPSDKAFEHAKMVTFEEFGDLISIPATEEVIDISIARIAFEKALAKAKVDGWRVVEADSFSVNQEDKKLKVGTVSSPQKLKQLILHEFATHFLRRAKGERSRLMLLGLGLDRYLRGDEGIATAREQIFGDKIEDFTGLEGHLAISLALGLDGKPRDFQGVFEILKKHFYLTGLVAGEDLDMALKSAQEKAYNRCIRTFRGTNCSVAGNCFLQDIVYREGNIGIWEVIKHNPTEMLRFNVGKYDPANPRHIWVLEQLGITDKDLQELEK